MAKKYDLKLKGTVGYWNFNQHTVDEVLDDMHDQEVHVLIDSLGGMVKEALSISSAFSAHGNVHECRNVAGKRSRWSRTLISISSSRGSCGFRCRSG